MCHCISETMLYAMVNIIHLQRLRKVFSSRKAAIDSMPQLKEPEMRFDKNLNKGEVYITDT